MATMNFELKRADELVEVLKNNLKGDELLVVSTTDAAGNRVSRKTLLSQYILGATDIVQLLRSLSGTQRLSFNDLKDAPTMQNIAQLFDDVSLSGTVLTFDREGGTQVEIDLAPIIPDTSEFINDASLNTNNNLITLTKANGNSITLDLSSFLQEISTLFKDVSLSGTELVFVRENDTEARVDLAPIIPSSPSTPGGGNAGNAFTAVSFANNILTFTRGDGTSSTIDLSALSQDISALFDSASFDESTNILTFTTEGGTSSTIDLSSLSQDVGSFFENASISGSVLTFTKQDGTTVEVQLPAGEGVGLSTIFTELADFETAPTTLPPTTLFKKTVSDDNFTDLDELDDVDSSAELSTLGGGATEGFDTFNVNDASNSNDARTPTYNDVFPFQQLTHIVGTPNRYLLTRFSPTYAISSHESIGLLLIAIATNFSADDFNALVNNSYLAYQTEALGPGLGSEVVSGTYDGKRTTAGTSANDSDVNYRMKAVYILPNPTKVAAGEPFVLRRINTQGEMEIVGDNGVFDYQNGEFKKLLSSPVDDEGLPTINLEQIKTTLESIIKEPIVSRTAGNVVDPPNLKKGQILEITGVGAFAGLYLVNNDGRYNGFPISGSLELLKIFPTVQDLNSNTAQVVEKFQLVYVRDALYICLERQASYSGRSGIETDTTRFRRIGPFSLTTNQQTILDSFSVVSGSDIGSDNVQEFSGSLGFAGAVWGRPDYYTSDSNLRAVFTHLIGQLLGCGLDGAGTYISSINNVKYKIDALGPGDNYMSITTCGTSSTAFGSYPTTNRITEIQFTNPLNESVVHYVYDNNAAADAEISDAYILQPGTDVKTTTLNLTELPLENFPSSLQSTTSKPGFVVVADSSARLELEQSNIADGGLVRQVDTDGLFVANYDGSGGLEFSPYLNTKTHIATSTAARVEEGWIVINGDKAYLAKRTIASVSINSNFTQTSNFIDITNNAELTANQKTVLGAFDVTGLTDGTAFTGTLLNGGGGGWGRPDYYVGDSSIDTMLWHLIGQLIGVCDINGGTNNLLGMVTNISYKVKTDLGAGTDYQAITTCGSSTATESSYFITHRITDVQFTNPLTGQVSYYSYDNNAAADADISDAYVLQTKIIAENNLDLTQVPVDNFPEALRAMMTAMGAEHFYTTASLTSRDALTHEDIEDGAWVYVQNNKRIYIATVSGTSVTFTQFDLDRYINIGTESTQAPKGAILEILDAIWIAKENTSVGSEQDDFATRTDIVQLALQKPFDVLKNAVSELQRSTASVARTIPYVELIIDFFKNFNSDVHTTSAVFQDGYSDAIDYSLNSDASGSGKLTDGLSYDDSSGEFSGIGSSKQRLMAWEFRSDNESSTFFGVKNASGQDVPIFRLNSGVLQVNTSGGRNNASYSNLNDADDTAITVSAGDRLIVQTVPRDDGRLEVVPVFYDADGADGVGIHLHLRFDELNDVLFTDLQNVNWETVEIRGSTKFKSVINNEVLNHSQLEALLEHHWADEYVFSKYREVDVVSDKQQITKKTDFTNGLQVNGVDVVGGGEGSIASDINELTGTVQADNTTEFPLPDDWQNYESLAVTFDSGNLERWNHSFFTKRIKEKLEDAASDSVGFYLSGHGADTLTVDISDADNPKVIIAAGSSAAIPARAYLKPKPSGPKGDKGDRGEGVPVGGTEGQILAKASGDDLDTEWVDAASGGDKPFYVVVTSDVTRNALTQEDIQDGGIVEQRNDLTNSDNIYFRSTIYIASYSGSSLDFTEQDRSRFRNFSSASALINLQFRHGTIVKTDDNNKVYIVKEDLVNITSVHTLASQVASGNIVELGGADTTVSTDSSISGDGSSDNPLSAETVGLVEGLNSSDDFNSVDPYYNTVKFVTYSTSNDSLPSNAPVTNTHFSFVQLLIVTSKIGSLMLQTAIHLETGNIYFRQTVREPSGIDWPSWRVATSDGSISIQAVVSDSTLTGDGRVDSPLSAEIVGFSQTWTSANDFDNLSNSVKLISYATTSVPSNAPVSNSIIGAVALQVITSKTSASMTQTALDLVTGKLYYRVLSSGSWGAWTEAIDSSLVTPTYEKLTTTSAAGASRTYNLPTGKTLADIREFVVTWGTSSNKTGSRGGSTNTRNTNIVKSQSMRIPLNGTNIVLDDFGGGASDYRLYANNTTSTNTSITFSANDANLGGTTGVHIIEVEALH